MNAQLVKIGMYQDRIRELYEQKFTKEDWENKKPEAVRWFRKCQKQAMTEIFNTK